MSEDVDELKMARPCKNCGGYYPGDCKCNPCTGGENGMTCDSCEEAAFLWYGNPDGEDPCGYDEY